MRCADCNKEITHGDYVYQLTSGTYDENKAVNPMMIPGAVVTDDIHQSWCGECEDMRSTWEK